MKSKPVRRKFIRQLEENLRAVLRDIDPSVVLRRSWEKLTVETMQADEVILTRLAEAMCNASGVTYVLHSGQGVMSRLHAGHLMEGGSLDIKVYAP